MLIKTRHLKWSQLLVSWRPDASSVDRVLKIAEGEIRQTGSPKASTVPKFRSRSAVRPVTAQAADYISNDETVNLKVCSFWNRLLKPRPVRLSKDLGSLQARCHAKEWCTHGGQSSVMSGSPPNPCTSDFGELQNEYRNAFDYRRGCVLAGWRRLVLGAWARLTRPVNGTAMAVLTTHIRPTNHFVARTLTAVPVNLNQG
jgi:hypothetical protein